MIYYILYICAFFIIFYTMKIKNDLSFKNRINKSIIYSIILGIIFPIFLFFIYFFTSSKLAEQILLEITFNLKTTFLVLVILFFLPIASELLKNKKNIKLTIFSIATIFLLIFLYFAFNNNLYVQKYEIESNNINNEEINIIQISDLHSTIYKNNQNNLVDNIKKLNPDIILLTGDIADDKVPFDGTKLLLDAVKDICPIYYVSGNHEYWADDFFNINTKIKSYGVHHLDDKFEIINIKGNEILVAGLDDPFKYTKIPSENIFERLNNLDSSINFSGLKILLSHRPELAYAYKDSKFNIIFSGHAHGGQVRIPFCINGIVAPDQGFFPKYAGGVYSLGNNKMVVSRGLSISSLPRIFNPPEIVFVTVKKPVQ